MLKAEHRAIERMLTVMEHAAANAEQGNDVKPEVFDDALKFIQTFADGCHHRKEEALLFPAMEQKGFPHDAGPIAVMLHEHDMGRSLVAKMKESLKKYRNKEANAAGDLAEYSRSFGELLRAHIAKEDNVLFVMADQHFSEEEQSKLLMRFEQVELEGEACKTKTEMISVLEKLEQQFSGSQEGN